jgi:hypothetical protein
VSTATDISVDELEEIFREERAFNPPPCEKTTGPSFEDRCAKEAVYVIRWGPDTRVPEHLRCFCRRTTKACLQHGELVMGARQNNQHWACVACDRFMVAVYIDKFRRA